MPKTKLSRANTTSSSLRTTVPQAVVESFNLKESDEISWIIQSVENEMVVVVRKA